MGAIESDSSFSSFTLTNFSNVGTRVDVVAPGSGITSTDIHNSYVDGIAGTSFSAPHVSGVAGMMYSVNPNITAKQVKDAIIASGATNKIGGYPLVDANKSVAQALGYTGNPNYNEKTNGILMGRVIEKETNIPLSDVYVSINGAAPQKIDLEDGHFEIILPTGNQEITFSKGMYETLTLKNIDMAENEVKYINDITLVKAKTPCYVNFQVKDATNNKFLNGSTIKYRKNWGNTSGEYVKDANGNEIQDTTNLNGKFNNNRELEGGYYTAEISLNGYVTGYENFA